MSPFDGDHALDELQMEDAIVAAAQPWAGVHWPSEDGAKFLFPNDREQWALQAEHDEWTCMVFAYRVLGAAGADVGPEASLPYETHQGLVALWLPNVGIRSNAYEKGPHVDPPRAGDIVCMLHASPHVSVIEDVNVLEDGSVDANAIDGGQVDEKGNHAIERRHRVYHVDASGLLHAREDSGRECVVLWVIRGSKLNRAA